MNRSAFWPKGPEPWYTTYRRHRPARPARSDGPRANAASTTYSRHAWPFQNPKSKSQNPKSRPAFTLVELLVTITIITMLAGLVLGGLRMARTAAREMKTKSTIAKLDEIIMRMYAGYEHRRVPIDTSGMDPNAAARERLDALRDTIQMEMPDSLSDLELTEGPRSGIARPALHRGYAALGNPTDEASAVCLYRIVSMAHPRELQHFSTNEIGTAGGFPVFVDGWDNPIRFIRWPWRFEESDIQGSVPDPATDSFDPRLTRPLVYSAGADGQPGINASTGAPDDNSRHDNIHNHRMEIR